MFLLWKNKKYQLTLLGQFNNLEERFQKFCDFYSKSFSIWYRVHSIGTTGYTALKFKAKMYSVLDLFWMYSRNYAYVICPWVWQGTFKFKHDANLCLRSTRNGKWRFLWATVNPYLWQVEFIKLFLSSYIHFLFK